MVVKEEAADVHEDTMETLRERLLDDFADELSGSQEDCNGEGKTEKDWSKVAERRGLGPILRENTLKMLEISTMIPFQYNKSWFACIFCKESFMTTYMLREHMLEHTRSDMEKKIISQQNKLIKVEISLLKCKLCGEESSNISSLDEFRRHIKDAHGVKLDNDLLVPYKLETEGMKCQICSETFDNFRLLHIHVNKHFWNHICEICGKSFTTLVFLNLHRTRFHRTYKCNECGLTFTSGAEKKQHDTNTHNVKFERKQRYPCQFCGERFFQESLKVQHLVDKHGVEKPEYKCSLCLKAFITKSRLNNHVKTVHKKERKHGCDICHSFFYTKSDVLRHRVTHTREKKFSCTLCKSAFATKDSLRKHLKRNACIA